MSGASRRLKTRDFELSPIKAMELAAAKIPGVVSLAQGIPSFDTPECIREYVIEMIEQGRCDKYSLTNGMVELREEISLALEEDGLSYDPDSEIIATCGSIEGITAALLATCSPGSEVIVPSPTYASYLGGIRIARCQPRYVKLDEENNFDFDVDSLTSAINSKTAAILYCSPNNPTGTLFSEQKTRALIDIAIKHDLTVIVDEVYKDFYYTDAAHFSPASIPEAKEHLIRVCSFSKAYAMTGWRIGFVLASKTNTALILGYHDAMVTCAPVVSQYAGIAALKYAREFLSASLEEYRRRRNYCIERLDNLSSFLDYQVPLATYFVFPRVKDSVPFSRDSNTLAYDLLHKARVATVPGIAFGPSGESHLRINFGRELWELEQGFDRLERYLTAPASKQPALDVGFSRQHDLPRSPSRQLFKQAASWFLSYCARAYLKNNHTRVIGIAGVSGKTVFKRTIAGLLSRQFKVRGNILSYNTEIGLPLSILNIESPRLTMQKLLLPFRALHAGLLKKEPLDFLVLEFGVSCTEDAQVLLQIARPDWLVLTGVEGPSSVSKTSALFEGLLELLKELPSERIFWPGDDSYFQNMSAELSEELRIVAGDNGDLPYRLKSDLAGRSAPAAALTAALLAEQLGCEKEQIQEWLLE